MCCTSADDGVCVCVCGGNKRNGFLSVRPGNAAGTSELLQQGRFRVQDTTTNALHSSGTESGSGEVVEKKKANKNNRPVHSFMG